MVSVGEVDRPATAVSRATALIEALIDGEHRPGDRLPSETDLSQLLGHSRATIREALGHLAAAGRVERRWGSGTFVTEAPLRSAMMLTPLDKGVPGMIRQAGSVPSVAALTIDTLPPAPELFPAHGPSDTWLVARTFAVDGVNAVQIIDRFPQRIGGRDVDPAPLESVDVLLWHVMRDAGVDFTSLELEWHATRAGSRFAPAFGIPDDQPVMFATGTGHSADGAVITRSDGVWNTDRLRLTATVRSPSAGSPAW
jgi:GntR family transcriptional regulator